MTVVAAVITNHCIAVASDSLLTVKKADGTRDVIESQKSKIVRVEKHRAAISYFGLAEYNGFSMYDWLQLQSNSATTSKTLADFAELLKERLQSKLDELGVLGKTGYGVGLHLTGYEWIGGYWIPELFLCSNLSDPVTYSAMPSVGLSRESYHILFEEAPTAKHCEEAYRLRVHKALNEQRFLVFNNGDPFLFLPAANGIGQMMYRLSERGRLKTSDPEGTARFMARYPVDSVAMAQRELCDEGHRAVGGKIHDLVITSSGVFSSNSGD